MRSITDYPLENHAKTFTIAQQETSKKYRFEWKLYLLFILNEKQTEENIHLPNPSVGGGSGINEFGSYIQVG